MSTQQIGLLALGGLILTVNVSQAAITRPKTPSEAPAILYRLPVVTAPLIKPAPVIDGTVGKEEWAAAAQTAPMINLETGLATDESTTLYFAYTTNTLYVAFQFSRPPYALEPLCKEGVWRGDTIEFYLQHNPAVKWSYVFAGDASGAGDEGKKESGTDKSWKCDWQYKARRTDWGWEGEMAIPFTSLDTQTPKVGDAWFIAPVCNQQTPTPDLACWSFLKNWVAAREDFGYLVFGGEAPAVRIINAGELSRNEVGMNLEAANSTSKDADLEVRLTLYQPKKNDAAYLKEVDTAANPLGPQAEIKEWLDADKVVQPVLQQYNVILKEEKNLVVPAGQSRRISLVSESTRGNYLIQYQVIDSASKMVLAGGPFPFFRRVPLEILITPFILSSGAVEIIADYLKLTDIQEGDMVVGQILDDSGKVLKEAQAPADLKTHRTAMDVPVAGLPVGAYTVQCLIKDKEGKTRAERKTPFTLPKIPDWWNNPYGHPEITDTVPEPWTQMVKTKKGFKVWNREITLDDALQPVQMTCGQTPLLIKPVSLQMKATGLSWGKPDVIKEKKTGISWKQALKGDGFTGELLLETEFDGLMKYTLTLTPTGKAVLDQLVLEVPLKPEIVTHYHHGALGTPPSYSAIQVHNGMGAVPKEGLALPFTEEIWLGNDEMGLEWVAESDQWWTPMEIKKTMEIVKADSATILRINMVNQPRTFQQPIKFQWGLLPTPVKPMNQELMRHLRFAQGAFTLDESMTKLNETTEIHLDALVEGDVNAYNIWAGHLRPESVWNQDFGAPGYRPTPLNEVRKKAFREATEMAHKKGIKWVVVYAIWNCFANWPDIGELWKEQALFPTSPSIGDGAYLYCCQKPFADWYIALLRKTIQEVGIDGVYLDSSASSHLCANIHHGCGYVDEKGNLHGTYPVFATREFHKRIYYLFHGEVKKGGLLYAHNSHFPFMAIESFVDVHHCGEGSQLTRDAAIPRFYGYPFGLPVSFTRWNSPVYPETRMNSWRFVLQVDSQIKAHPSYAIDRKKFPDAGKKTSNVDRNTLLQKGYAKDGEALWPVWQAYKTFPWEGSQWHPAWRIGSLATTGDDDLWVCMHLNPGKAALITVSSFKEQDANCKVKLDWKAMGFQPDKVIVTDKMLFKEIPSEPDGVTLDVKTKLFRFFEIRPK